MQARTKKKKIILELLSLLHPYWLESSKHLCLQERYQETACVFSFFVLFCFPKELVTSEE